MRIGVMQPYIFPYIGYYQLAFYSDIFVLYDDVNYIKKGYINRNNILLNKKAHRFTFPVISASQNKKINELSFSPEIENELKLFSNSYKKAPYFNKVFPLIENTLTLKDKSIPNICLSGITTIFDYLNIKKKIIFSSTLNYDQNSNATDKLISITTSLGGNEYVNSYGGMHLYNKNDFNIKNIDLTFIKPSNISYNQNNIDYIENLSIIDILMWCPPTEVISLLEKYHIIK